ncbi:MAG: PEGA domain-containing protein [Trueperaceae bacterium]|nr:PEGA domain-containing protein [Trueperaceae bacterium]
MKKLFSLILFAFVSLSLAQPNIVFSPQTIVINPIPSFGVEVFVNKDPSGDSTPTYSIGEQITIGVRVTEASYVYLFDVRSNGTIDQIIPNRMDPAGENNYLQAGETKLFPPQGARYTFSVDGPQGTDKVIAVASKEPLDTRQLADFGNNGNFASSNIGQEGFAQTLSIIIRPKPQNSWVTDTALFNVGNPPAAPRYGTISITSSPNRAEAYVDGQYIGLTPVRYGTTSGSHTVEVRASGYQTYSSSVNVPGGQTTAINATLNPVVSTGTVNFVSQPQGAQVYVDGQYIGVTPTGAVSFNAGSHQVRFVLNGYSENSYSFNVNAGSSQTISGELRALSGSLTTRSNIGGALIFIDGQQAGSVTNGTGVNSFSGLAAGNHELVVIAPGFSTHVSTVTIRGGETVEVQVTQTSLSR